MVAPSVICTNNINCMILSECLTEHGTVLSPRFYELGDDLQLHLRSEFAESKERGALIAFGVELRDRADEIAQYGSLYLSAFEDPMSEACSTLYGEVFMACQGLGIPVVFSTDEMLWADGYGLYARFLGVRKDLVSFGCTMGSALTTGSSYAERFKGLQSLRYYQFHTWSRYLLSDELSSDLDQLRELAGVCSVIYLSPSLSQLARISNDKAAHDEFATFIEDVMGLESTAGVSFRLSADIRLDVSEACPDVFVAHFSESAQQVSSFASFGERVEAYDVAEVIEEVMDSTREEAIRLHKERRESKS